MTKYYHSNINRTKHREFVGFFEKASFALEKRHRSVAIVLDGTNLNLASTHNGTVCNGSSAGWTRTRALRTRWSDRRGEECERESQRLESQCRPCACPRRNRSSRWSVVSDAGERVQLCILELSLLEMVLGSDVQHLWHISSLPNNREGWS